MKNAFGVQKIVPIVEQPKGTTVLSLNFSPSPAKSVTDEMTQQTTDTTKPDLESQTKTKDSDGSGEKQSDAEDLVKALQEAVARGDIQVETLGENVVVNFTPTEAEQKDLPQLLQQTLMLHLRIKQLSKVKSFKDLTGSTLDKILLRVRSLLEEVQEK